MQAVQDVRTSTQPEEITKLVRTAQSFPEGSAEYTRAAWNLCAACQVTIKKIAFSVGSREDEVDDLVQDANLKIVAKLYQLKEPAYFFTWVRRIILNLRINTKRGINLFFSYDDLSVTNASDGSKEYTQPIADPGIDFETPFILGMYLARLFEVIAEEEKILLELYYIDKVGPEILADLLGITQVALRVKLLRIKRRLEVRADELDSPVVLK